MTAPNLRLAEFTGRKMIFLLPSDFRYRSTVLWQFGNKAPVGVKNVTLDSSKWSLRTNSAPTVPGCSPETPCTDLPREQSSIFTEISYSVQNKARLVQDLEAHIANIRILMADLAEGLPPRLDVALVGPSA